MDMTKPTILIVEDEPEVLNINARMLKRHGYRVLTADSVQESNARLKEAVPDLLILDIMLPDGSGYDVCEEFRRISDNPVVFLTGKNEISDKVEGLARGGDYYLTKPFDSRELLACVGALLRRQGEQVDELTFGNTALDLSAGMLRCGSKSVRLSAREFDVMRILLQAKGGNVSKETLLERVWGFDSNAVENHVEVYAGFLRKKLASIGSNVRIEAIRRLGYHLEVAEA